MNRIRPRITFMSIARCSLRDIPWSFSESNSELVAGASVGCAGRQLQEMGRDLLDRP